MSGTQPRPHKADKRLSRTSPLKTKLATRRACREAVINCHCNTQMQLLPHPDNDGRILARCPECGSGLKLTPKTPEEIASSTDTEEAPACTP